MLTIIVKTLQNKRHVILLWVSRAEAQLSNEIYLIEIRHKSYDRWLEH